MSKQVETVSVAVEGVEPSVATTESAVPAVDRGLVAQLVDEARRQGLPVDGEGGLLAELTRLVLESALEGEITDHLGYDKHEKGGSVDGNARNGVSRGFIGSALPDRTELRPGARRTPGRHNRDAELNGHRIDLVHVVR